MVPDHADRVLRFIMTDEKNMAAGNLPAQLAAIATVILKYGTTYLPSLKMMEKVIIQN